MNVYVVAFCQYDIEGTFTQVVGVASTPEGAAAIQAEHTRQLLEKRTREHAWCAKCGFSKELHDALVRQELVEAAKRGVRTGALLDCPYVSPPPVTKIRDNEDYEINEFVLDAMPVIES